MFDEHADAFVLQFADDTSPQIDHLLVVIRHTFLLDALEDVLLTLGIKEAEEQLHGLLVGNDLQFVGIFEVHDLIADIIGSLDEIHQRMTGILERFACLRETGDA